MRTNSPQHLSVKRSFLEKDTASEYQTTMKKPLSIRLRWKPVSISVFILLSSVAWQLQAATSIENDRYKVNIEAGEGTFTVAVKPSGKPSTAKP